MVIDSREALKEIHFHMCDIDIGSFQSVERAKMTNCKNSTFKTF
jgi:hypothetical protein